MLNELALFAGAGGGILGGHLLGWRTVCAVECNAYAASVLVARQNDGTLAPFPIWDDVCTFDGRPWRGRVDVLSGGFPCQDISSAGQGAGIDGARSGLWAQMARIIGEVRPQFVLVENSPMLTSRGLGRVLGDLAALGYDARWGVLGACDAGAPHRRERIWVVGTLANPAQVNCHESDDVGEPCRPWEGKSRGGCGIEDVLADTRHMCRRHGSEPSVKEIAATSRRGEMGDALREGWQGADPIIGACCDACGSFQVQATTAPDVGRVPRVAWWETEPNVGRVADGVAARVDRLAALGNGQVPAVVCLAWRALISEWSGA